MKISNGLAMLELQIQGFVLNPTLIWDEETAILIDTGMPGQLEQIRSVMNDAGVPFDRLQAVIVTHQDLDHIGSLPEIQAESNHPIEVYAHELDKPYIEGVLHLMKTDPNQMSNEQWMALPKPMQFLYKNPPTAKVNQTLEDGQKLPFCGGIQVVFTPGHAPGHISLYIENSKTLIAGDAMICVDGNLRGPVPQTTPDMETAFHSLKKFLELDIETVICYHGGICNVDVREQLERIIEMAQVNDIKG
ncbi:MBL fold metallo-hydrolase [Bacillus sp. DX4.1]|uniref:MBL fold metallo-hydrolase n=1 Tax=Bacillus sp. DX4.1 TaxID=3055867 RepID=UPI0025A090C6|nr:MBL fold metallo-hydrolase [Bacillus sp. DX4.1]MDM5188884.1 MBL fold metallo-hydrolase [Bacillus sp. DX4.1]